MLNIDWHALRVDWESAPHGSKKSWLERQAKYLNCSVDTLYRGLRKKHGKKKTVVREKTIKQEVIDMIADLKLKGAAIGLNEREISTEHCIETLIRKGVPGAKNLTVSSVNRRLVQSGFRMRDPKVRYEARFANQEFQLDFSRSKYFQMWKFDKDRGDYLLKVTGKELHYKMNDNRFRTWLVQVVDSYSRIRIARAYGATGESGLMGLEFLNFCFNRPEDSHPLRYLPVYLKTDNGAFEKKKEVKSALEALQIEPRRSKPYNKDSQGKVERKWREAWQGFELPLALDMLEAGNKTIYLSEYNDLLHEFCINEIQNNHPIKSKELRADLYRESILKYPPREIDLNVLEVACSVQERTVKADLMISLNGQKYEAPVYCLDKRIRVYRNMYGELIGELLEEDRKPFTLTEYRFRDIDDFENRHSNTYRQERKKLIKSEAKADSKPASVNSESNRLFFTPKPEMADVKSPFANAETAGENFPSIYAAKVYIGQNLPGEKTYKEFAEVFDEMLAKTLSKSEIDEVLIVINNGPKLRLSN